MIDIKDNFLSDKDFFRLQDQILGTDTHHFPWILSQIVRNNPTEKDPRMLNNIQLCHGFYDKHAPVGETIQIIYPILQKVQPVAILRIKANLLMRRDTIIEHGMHHDVVDADDKMNYLLTSIFYLNTCNGYTRFETGEKVESVANRFVTFPQSLRHCGTTCTDQPFRSVINFNYVPGNS